jgi:hypothetical protein
MIINGVGLLSLMTLLVTACEPYVASAKSAGPTQTIPPILNHPGPLEYDQGIWLPGVPPNGSWQVEISSRDILQMGMMQSYFKNDWEGKYTLTFKDGNYTITWWDPQGNIGHCQAKYDADRYVVRLTYIDLNKCSQEVDYFLWRIDGDELHFHLLGVENASFIDRMVVFEARVWTRVH